MTPLRVHNQSKFRYPLTNLTTSDRWTVRSLRKWAILAVPKEPHPYDTALNDVETLELAQRLVRIDSVNPSLVPGAAGEAARAHFVAGVLENRDVDVELRDALPGRPNVIGRIPGTEDGPSLLLCCHLDTVSVEGMEAPFSGEIDEEGRLHGRGAQDVKGGLAAMLAAAVTLSKKPPRGDVIVACVADEEAYSAGTEALLKWGIRADMAIVFEPSELDVVVAHKGFAWAHVTTHGVAAHGSRPREGVDAIAHMGRVLAAVEALWGGIVSEDPARASGRGLRPCLVDSRWPRAFELPEYLRAGH